MDGRRYAKHDASAGPLGPQAHRAWRAHDLTRRELAATQRAVRALDRQGRAPSPNAFFETTALPRAERFAAAVRAALELEGPGTGPVAGMDPIDQLGRWWQRQLRRRAVALALPRLVGCLPSEVDLVVAHHEMYLLDQAPWSHGDRLLSAFELAHADLRRYARSRFHGADRPRGSTGPGDGVSAEDHGTPTISISW